MKQHSQLNSLRILDLPIFEDLSSHDNTLIWAGQITEICDPAQAFGDFLDCVATQRKIFELEREARRTFVVTVDKNLNVDLNLDANLNVTGNLGSLTFDATAIGNNSTTEADVSVVTTNNLSEVSGSIFSAVI